ncbi:MULTISPECIES: hypothetical protein [Nocardiopsis]|uniref:hypothetical protein n=1 Tax=Nocardiopsis TaxID=2013 RepID=UPI0009328488|nr:MULTISPECIES: hypothetical protein [Nocardiopsis]MBQ1081579.1 hypothetical protein [Nocardiopsis sp. B62]
MAWKRIKKRQETYPLGRLKLYRDELEDIARVLAEFGTLSFLVNEDEVSGNEPEDFARMADELPDRLGLVQMSATKEETRVVVEIGSDSRVVLIEPNNDAYGSLTRIKKICAPCRMNAPLWVILSFVPAGIALALYNFVSFMGGESKELETATSFLLAVSLVVMLVTIVTYAIRGIFDFTLESASRDIILNVNRAERPTFKERLIADRGVALFWAVFGAILGYLGNQLPGL